MDQPSHGNFKTGTLHFSHICLTVCWYVEGDRGITTRNIKINKVDYWITVFPGSTVLTTSLQSWANRSMSTLITNPLI